MQNAQASNKQKKGDEAIDVVPVLSTRAKLSLSQKLPITAINHELLVVKMSF